MKSKLWMVAAIITCGLLLTSCTDVTGNDDNPVGPVNPEPTTPTNIVEPSDFSSYIDMNTYAGDDFYQYAVGKWLADNPLEVRETENGTNAQHRKNKENFLSSLKSSADEVIRRLRNDFSPSSTSSDLAILKDRIKSISSIKSIEDMYASMGQLMLAGYQTPFYFSSVAYERVVSPIFAMPDKASFYATDWWSLHEYAGLTEEDAEKAEEIINSWKEMLVANNLVASKSGSIPRDIDERRLVKFNSARTRAGETNPLLSIFTSMGLSENIAQAMIYGEYEHINKFLASLTLDQLKLFNIYIVANRDLDYIPLSESEDFETLLTRLVEAKYSPLSVRVSDIFNKTIPAASRTEAIAMATEYRNAFRERVSKLSWMSGATKAKAIEKIDNMDFCIGWPDDDSKRGEWTVKVPAGVAEGKSSFYTDALDLHMQQASIVNEKLNSTSTEDLFYAEEVSTPSYQNNAFFSQVNNAVYILSSNLVPPVFDPSRSDAFKYGVLGFTIGHEITHGFDPKGKDYDKTGRRAPWMAKADSLAFDALSKKMIARFNTLAIGDIYKCDGRRTVTENTADLGGLYIGYDAYMNLLARKGVTGAERDRQGREFFRAFAYAWMANMSELAIKLFENDVHAPNPLRVNGNVYLMDEFYRLFNISSGNMYLPPVDRIEIW